jgi:hypothetical protein
MPKTTFRAIEPARRASIHGTNPSVAKSSSIHIDVEATLNAFQRFEKRDEKGKWSTLRIELEFLTRWVNIIYSDDQDCETPQNLSLPLEDAIRIHRLLSELLSREKVFVPLEGIEGFVDVATSAK